MMSRLFMSVIALKNIQTDSLLLGVLQTALIKAIAEARLTAG